MKEQPEALRLADELDGMPVNEFYEALGDEAAAELRRLSAENAALRKAAEAASCSNTFDCQCPKHFASQQSEQRPKRVLTAVWRDRAQRAEAQRDALLEVCKTLVALPGTEDWAATLRLAVEQARAAIKAVEGEGA